MVVVVVVGISVLGAGLLALATLTGLGELRRGARAPLAALAGILFPITWIVWYLKDERPVRRLSRRAA